MKRSHIIALVAALVLVVIGCDTKDMVQTPLDGTIVSGPTVQVSGVLPQHAASGGTLQVNTIPTPIAADRTWTQAVPISGAGLIVPIEVIYTDPNGTPWRQRQAVVNGPKLDEGQYSPNGVGMRFTNTGLNNLGPVIKDLAGASFDIGGLLLAQNPIINQPNAFLTFDITGNAYEAGVGSVDIAAASTTGGATTHITIEDLYVGVALNISDGLAINTNCSLELQIPTTTIDATFDLTPLASNHSKVDVNMIGTPTVNTGSVNYEFISGICDGDTFLIGDIVNSVAGPQIQSLIGAGFSSNLGDPDGAGPLDSPIAGAIQTALGDISIAGSIGQAIKANLDAPFTQINEGASGIDFRADADFFSTFGAGPTDCQPAAGAPDLASTYDVPGTYPTLGVTTPGGNPYGLGLVISASAFNQLLGSMTECGILNSEITEVSLGGPALPITSSVLAGIIPEFGTKLPANTPMKIKVKPTVAPFITANPGPNGTSAELMLANLQIEFVLHDASLGDLVLLSLAVDAPLGFDLAYDPALGVLAPTITAPTAAQVTTRVVNNGIITNEPNIEALFPNLFPLFVGSLGSSFAAFPLPSFLGLQLNVLEVQRAGNYFVLYANLDQALATHLENVTVTDLSTTDSVVDTSFDVNEWRHHLRPKSTSTNISVDYKGMIGADACCTVGDESKTAHAGYRVTFDVVPAEGETWQLALDQAIAGAHTLLDEKVALEDAGAEAKFTSSVTGRARIDAGAWQNFNVTPSVMSAKNVLYGGEGNTYKPFTGSASLVLSGTTTQTITIEFGVDVYAKSDSNAFFPAAGGDEAGLRFGAHDTIANGFSAGGYPGLGNRNIMTDGWFSHVTLTSSP